MTLIFHCQEKKSSLNVAIIIIAKKKPHRAIKREDPLTSSTI